jgi:hypothetical protein
MPRLTHPRFSAHACFTLVACSRHAATDEPAQHEEGPDEFAVLPTAPLEMPENMASLPEPTPGARNRVDPDPEATPSRRSAGTRRALVARAPTW